MSDVELEEDPTWLPENERVVMRALYDFEGADETELSFCEGDTFTLLKRIDGGWCCGIFHKTGDIGHYPEGYVESLGLPDTQTNGNAESHVSDDEDDDKIEEQPREISLDEQMSSLQATETVEEEEEEEEVKEIEKVEEVKEVEKVEEVKEEIKKDAQPTVNVAEQKKEEDKTTTSAESNIATAAAAKPTSGKKEHPSEDSEKLISSRKKIAAETLSTEQSYVRGIQVVIQHYITPLQERIRKKKGILNPDQMSTVFSNIELLVNVNKELLERLEQAIANWNESSGLGQIFVEMAPFLRGYSQYCNEFEVINGEVERLLKSNSRFKRFCKKATQIEDSRGLDLMSYLIMPIQRVPRYVLLLQDLLRHTPTCHSDYSLLQSGLKMVKEVASSINSSVAQFQAKAKLVEIEQHLNMHIGLVQPHRYYIMDSTLSLLHGATQRALAKDSSLANVKKRSLKKGATVPANINIRDVSALRAYLLNDMIIFADERRYLDRVMLQLVYFSEPASLGELGFELTCPTSGLSSTFQFIANDAEEKQKWKQSMAKATEELLRTKPVYKVQRDKFLARVTEQSTLSAKEKKKKEKNEKKFQKKVKKAKDHSKFV